MTRSGENDFRMSIMQFDNKMNLSAKSSHLDSAECRRHLVQSPAMLCDQHYRRNTVYTSHVKRVLREHSE